jgi:hypothetical protein
VDKDLTITGPTVTLGNAPKAQIDAQEKGGGFIINTSVTVTMNNILIKNGITDSGGGISNEGKLDLNNVWINNCTAKAQGGGILNYYGTCNVNSSHINSNIADDGGGIYNYSGIATVTSSTINGNIAIMDGGGIHNSGTLTASNSHIDSNTANYGGGICNYGTFTVTDSTINNNNTNGDHTAGGGIYNVRGSLTVTKSDINSNIADNGGGIYNYKINVIMNDSSIYNNKATVSGGGIYNTNGGTVTIRDNLIIGNSNYDIYCVNGSVDAALNWWGSNADPSNKVYGNVTVTPWLASDNTLPPTVTANPTGGTYNSAKTVTLTTTDPDSTVTTYYTKDGNDPKTSGTRITYINPIQITTTTLLRFIAVDPNGNWSPN